MTITVETLIIIAKQHKIDELKRLASSTLFIEVISNFIHSLQAERGASSLYLASSGHLFDANKRHIVVESQRFELRFREMLAQQLSDTTFINTQQLSVMAWVVLGLDDIGVLRKSIQNQEISALATIRAFSRLISGLISMMFDLADSVVDPRISNLLVAQIHLVQAKELAGQERALGCYAFASAKIDVESLQKFSHLIDNQTRFLAIFREFATPDLVAKLDVIEQSEATEALNKLRALMTSTHESHLLATGLSEDWFKYSSHRLTDLWSLQCELIHRIKTLANTLVHEAENELHDVKGVIARLRNAPPEHANLVDRFFDPDIPVEQSLRFIASSLHHQPTRSMVDILQMQSKRLAETELALQDARTALAERKLIERAKGMLMTKQHISEELAYERLRSEAMSQSKSLFEVAQSVIAMSALL